MIHILSSISAHPGEMVQRLKKRAAQTVKTTINIYI